MRFLPLALRARHEPTDAQGGGRISQYLQHCTTKRTDAKDWAVTTMVEDIEPLLAEVENTWERIHSYCLPLQSKHWTSFLPVRQQARSHQPPQLWLANGYAGPILSMIAPRK